MRRGTVGTATGIANTSSVYRVPAEYTRNDAASRYDLDAFDRRTTAAPERGSRGRVLDDSQVRVPGSVGRWRTAVSTRNKNITYLGPTETVSLASRRRVARTAQRAGPRGRDRTAVITADKLKEIRPLVPGGAARCAADPHPAPHGAGETGRGSAPRGRERSREQPRALDEHLFSITHVAGYSSLSL